MKKFEVPMMMIVQLSNEDVITGSACDDKVCQGYYCDDCVECEGKYNCLEFLCKYY